MFDQFWSRKEKRKRWGNIGCFQYQLICRHQHPEVGAKGIINDYFLLTVNLIEPWVSHIKHFSFYQNLVFVAKVCLTRPKPPSWRQGLAGSWGKDTVTPIHWKSLPLTENHSHSMKITLTQWKSLPLTENHSHSLKINPFTESHSHSMKITLTPTDNYSH